MTQKVLLFVGTYTQKEGHVDGKAKGIGVLQFDSSDGSISEVPGGSVAEFPGPNPSFVCVHPHGKPYLYAISENSKGPGPVVSFSIDPSTGSLKKLNETSCRGASGCYVKVDSETGKYLFVANYDGGNLLTFRIDPETGKLDEEPTDVIQHPHEEAIRSDPERQCQAHAHCIKDWVSPDGTQSIIFSCDLGLDRVYRYRLDRETGKLHPLGHTTVPKLGAGPRHVDFHPHKPIVYVICELDSTIAVFSIDSSSHSLEHLQTISTLPSEGDWSTRSHCADIHVHPSGQFLYASNRGHDSIAMFSIDPANGKLTSLGHESTQGAIPRNFTLDSKGEWLLVANQNTDTIVSFKIDSSGDGRLKQTGKVFQTPTPVCLVISSIPAPSSSS